MDGSTASNGLELDDLDRSTWKDTGRAYRDTLSLSWSGYSLIVVHKLMGYKIWP